MKKVLILLSFLFSICIYAQENKGAFEIHGEIEGVEKGKIRLMYDDLTLKSIVKKGKFKFKGSINHEYKAYLIFDNKRSVPFYIENIIIAVRLSPEKLYRKQGAIDMWCILPEYVTLTDSLSRNDKNFIGKNNDLPTIAINNSAGLG